MPRSVSLLFGGLAIAAVVAISSAWIASSDPDGLERVAEDQQFIERAEDPSYNLLPDYTVPGVSDEQLSTALAGVIGVVVVSVLTMAVARALRRPGPRNESS